MRRLIRPLLCLALSCLATPLAAQATDRLPPNRMIVYDSSGSMWATGPDGERRYRLAQAFLRQLVARARTEPAPVTLGLLSLGRRYLPEQGMCERDIEVEVAPAGLIGTTVADRVEAAAEAARPRGQTPIYDALLRAADQVPVGDGATLVVLTDLDDEICGAPPCDVVAELARRGRPYPEKTRIEFLVEIGVDPDRSPIVQRLRRCLPGVRVVTVGTLEEAERKGRAVAEELAARTAAPSVPPPQPEQAAPAADGRRTVRVEFGLAFPPDTLRFEGDLRRSGLRLRSRSLAGVAGQDVAGDTLVLDVPPGPLDLKLLQDTLDIDSWDAVVTGRGPVRIARPLAPARVTLEGDQLPPGAQAAWSVTDLATGASRSVAGGRELLIAPGRYEVAARAEGRQAREELSLGFGQARVLRLPPPQALEAPPPPPVGVLAVEARVQRHALTTRDVAPAGVQFQLDGPARRNTTGPAATLAGLPPGQYATSAHAAGLGTTAPPVAIDAGQTTRLALLLAPARLRLDLHDGAQRVVWRLTRHGTGEALERRGPVLDLALPPGRYRVEVWAEEGRAVLEEVEVRDYVRHTLKLI